MRARLPGLTAFGLGGTEMAAAGLERIVRAEDVAVMGITEVLRHMPRIYGEYRKLVASIRSRRPDVAVLIDFPDVNLRLARELRKLGVPMLFFVSPQLWAWKRRRLRWVQERVDRMMVIFPFEEPFYRARGVQAEFVGHPLAALPLPSITREEYAARYYPNPSKQWLALLPGSRRKEVALNLPEMLRAALILNKEQPLEVVVPAANTVGREFVWSELKRSAGSEKIAISVVDDARAALFHARASVVASGTATVQAAVLGNPFVVVYRVSPLTFGVARRLVRYPEEIPAQKDAHGNLPIGMVNLIAGRRIVPELLQENFTGANVAAALRPLLDDGPARETMMADIAEVRRRLLPAVGADPILRVCDAVQVLLAQRSSGHGPKPATERLK